MELQSLRSRKKSSSKALQTLVKKRQKKSRKSHSSDHSTNLSDKRRKRMRRARLDHAENSTVVGQNDDGKRSAESNEDLMIGGKGNGSSIPIPLQPEEFEENAGSSNSSFSDHAEDSEFMRKEDDDSKFQLDRESRQNGASMADGLKIRDPIPTNKAWDGTLVYDSDQDPDFMMESGEQSSSDDAEIALPEKTAPDDVLSEDFDLQNSNSLGDSSDENPDSGMVSPEKGARIDQANDSDIEEDNLGFRVARIDYTEVSSRLQSMIRERHVSSRKCPKKPKKKGLGRNMPLHASHKSDTSIRRLWVQAVRRLRERDPDFFTSKEARLEEEDAARKGKPAYASVPISQFNNCDIQSIFETEYDRKVKQGGSYSSFLQLVTVAGQYLRLCVVRGLTTVGTLWESGKLFRAIGDMDTVDLFLSHYDARAQCTTVMTKALHLRKICEHAKLHFMDGDRTCFANAERARVKLQKVFNAQKSLSRSLASRKKQMEERIADGLVFLDHDFEKCCKIVRRTLDNMIQSFEEVKCDSGIIDATTVVESTDFTRKWFMNFMLLLLFAAGGQRPQTYTKLQAPNESELLEMKNQASSMHFFEVRTLFEKTRRSLDMPNVLVPAHVMKYFEFHVNVMRKVVLRLTEVEECDSTERPLLMHTQHGTELRRSQVTRCLRSFLSYHVPEMKSITVMALRSSYGTITMQAYRQKKIFRGMSEDEFLSVLAKYMNTSPEQLMTTYIGIDRSDFETSARELVKVLDFSDNTALDPSPNENDDTFPTSHRNVDPPNRENVSYESIFGY